MTGKRRGCNSRNGQLLIDDASIQARPGERFNP
jgi:hypothetical protein